MYLARMARTLNHTCKVQGLAKMLKQLLRPGSAQVSRQLYLNESESPTQ